MRNTVHVARSDNDVAVPQTGITYTPVQSEAR